MLLTVLYIIGITAEGMTGALAAGRQKLDLFGVIMVAEVTALGGGTARDVVLGHYPLTWVKHPEYLLVVAGAAILAVMISKFMHHFHRLFIALDAVGLAVFTVLGVRVAIEMGYGFIIAVVAAVFTGVAGGIFRDIFCNRIPLVFQKELYASVVVIGVCVYWLMDMAGVKEEITWLTTIIVVFAVRMLAVRFEWSLPVFEYQEREYHRDADHTLWPTRDRLRRLRDAGRRRLHTDRRPRTSDSGVEESERSRRDHSKRAFFRRNYPNDVGERAPDTPDE